MIQIFLMKKILKFAALILFTGVLLNIACKKEYSCEGCYGNKPPVANAVKDTTIILPVDSVNLDGSASYDPDGTITGFTWRKISGPVSFSILNASAARTNVMALTSGVYQFELKVTDNKGLSAKDTMMVIVDVTIVTNHPPIANAGPDQVITLPTNTITLNGTASFDPDNNITGYAWAKISGSSAFNITNTNAVQTAVTNLVQGIYQFELKVTDATMLFSKDTVQVTVKNLPTPCTDCKIVFVSTRDGNAEIYSCNVDGSNIHRLTNDAGHDDHPAWSPDGTQIAFISDRSGNPDLYIMNKDGSNLVRRTYSGSYTEHPAWSPDGTKIVYSALSNGSADIWVINATSGSPTLLFNAPGWDNQPKWSPDGLKIALVSDWMAYDFVYDIYTINADGTGFTTLTGNIFDHIDYLNPSWSPTGTKLAMAMSQTIAINQYKTQIGIMNSNGSVITVIMPDAATWSRTSWSGDGTRIAYTSLSGSGMDVSWVSADGSAWGTIVTNGWNADWQH